MSARAGSCTVGDGSMFGTALGARVGNATRRGRRHRSGHGRQLGRWLHGRSRHRHRGAAVGTAGARPTSSAVGCTVGECVGTTFGTALGAGVGTAAWRRRRHHNGRGAGTVARRGPRHRSGHGHRHRGARGRSLVRAASRAAASRPHASFGESFARRDGDGARGGHGRELGRQRHGRSGRRRSARLSASPSERVQRSAREVG
mmetsp:Transcript_282/g.1048  ORF Transcript_282/g.1048 Transcript_282/m.1048 type:complete len:202 (+) Transcript_282:77-682(+)